MHDSPRPPGDEEADSPPLDLRHLLRVIDREWPGWLDGPMGTAAAPWGFLVGVESPSGRVVHRPLDSHPAQALTDWIAPRHWAAVGVTVRGNTRRTALDGSFGPEPHPGPDARVVWLCHRDGRNASLIGLTGDAATVTVTWPDERPADEGRVPRLLRASLRGSPPAGPVDPLPDGTCPGPA